MTLISEVTALCNRLASGGWHNLLLHHGLDILAPSLEHELRKPLRIDRSQSGFEDFCATATRGIEPGVPAQSLLYHALANPNVAQDALGNPLQTYPTPAELETVLNWVYAIEPPSIEQLKERAQGAPLAVVVFAYEYRPAPDTVHKTHADLCFSRTGVSRVGTAPALYDAQRRGFLPFIEGDDHGIRVLPARYSAYVAIQRKGNLASFGPMRFTQDDDTRDFWVPLHKLFNGDECIAGMHLDVELQACHKNEKLRRIHTYLGADSGWGEPDISHPPFVMTEGLARWLEEDRYGAGLLCALAHNRLVEPAHYLDKPLTFRVPARPDLVESSMVLFPGAPQFVHLRHEVDADGNVVDLNQQADMMDELRKGSYNAQHYLDFTADGSINSQCVALDNSIPRRIAAYSLLCAPDFYPLCTQRRLSDWLDSLPIEDAREIFPVPPRCLSDNRMPANIQSFASSFDKDDVGITAIVAQNSYADTSFPIGPKVASAQRASCLPDAAAGTFAPGWDTGLDTNEDELLHLAAYTLGSPFPEDAKLCAARSSYWPAVAPDSAQEFESSNGQTIKPMLDTEIGLNGGLSWDGITPPKHYINNEKSYISYTSYLYGDYTQNALNGKFTLALTGKVNSQEYQQRVYALWQVRRSMGPAYQKWRVTSFRVATNDDLQQVKADAKPVDITNASVYRFELTRSQLSPSSAFDKVDVAVMDTLTFLVWPQCILRKQAAQSWKRI